MKALEKKKKKSIRKSGVASQTVFHRSQEFQGPSAMCHVPGPSRPRFTPSVRLICGQPSMCPSSLASRSAQPTQIGEEWIPAIYTTFVALEPAHRVPGCYLGTEMPWEMPWGIPEPARQSFADQPSTPVNCNWCEPSCLMAFRQKSQVTLKSRYSIVSLSLPFFFFFWKQWFCLCFPGRWEIIRVIPFAKSLTGFQNAQRLCLVMTWFLSEVNNNSKKNSTGWGQCEWQKILSHRILQGIQSCYFRYILWRKSVTKNKRLWRRGCRSSQ